MFKLYSHSLLFCVLFGLWQSSAFAETANPLGSFNFDFSRVAKNEAQQIAKLKKMGYSGLTMGLNRNISRSLQVFDRYLKECKKQNFKIYAGFITTGPTKKNPVLHPQLKLILQKLKAADAKLWVILRNTTLNRGEIVSMLKKAADQAKAAGVELVIYPHYAPEGPKGHINIESAEEALGYIKEAKHDNLFVSLHLCHEIRAGNGDRLTEVAQKIKKYIRLSSINGADKEYKGQKDWSRTIQPLGSGDYDSSKLLTALSAIDYKGPIILHTFGLQKQAANHHKTSIKAYRKLWQKAGSKK